MKSLILHLVVLLTFFIYRLMLDCPAELVVHAMGFCSQAAYRGQGFRLDSRFLLHSLASRSRSPPGWRPLWRGESRQPFGRDRKRFLCFRREWSRATVGLKGYYGLEVVDVEHRRVAVRHAAHGGPGHASVAHAAGRRRGWHGQSTEEVGDGAAAGGRWGAGLVPKAMAWSHSCRPTGRCTRTTRAQ